MRNLNYSILQGELEHEAALEDMHMFFVAFNKRQKKIVECLEEPGKVKKPHLLLLEESPEAKRSTGGQLNVEELEDEIDLE
jgi:hypothetical protein